VTANGIFRDILESIESINEFLRGMDFLTYERDDKIRAAVERHGQLSQALVSSSLGRNAWNTVQDDLPLMKRIAEDALSSSSSSSPNEKADPG
jgi:uncharacterized protein with HEPN domain